MASTVGSASASVGRAFDVRYAESAVAVAFSGAGRSAEHKAAVEAVEGLFRRVGPSVGVSRAAELLQRTERADAAFYALQTLQWAIDDVRGKGADVSIAEVMGVRDVVFAYLKSVIDASASPARTSMFDTPFIASKFSVVYALLIRRCYPATWATAFSDLLQLLVEASAGPTTRSRGLDFFLRTLDAIDEEIVLTSFVAYVSKVSVERTTAIKDAARRRRRQVCRRVVHDAHPGRVRRPPDRHVPQDDAEILDVD